MPVSHLASMLVHEFLACVVCRLVWSICLPRVVMFSHDLCVRRHTACPVLILMHSITSHFGRRMHGRVLSGHCPPNLSQPSTETMFFSFATRLRNPHLTLAVLSTFLQTNFNSGCMPESQRSPCCVHVCLSPCRAQYVDVWTTREWLMC